MDDYVAYYEYSAFWVYVCVYTEEWHILSEKEKKDIQSWLLNKGWRN